MVPTKTYKSRTMDDMYHQLAEREYFAAHKVTIERALRAIGADGYNKALPETRILPLIIHPSEIIEGIMYGRYKQEQSGVETLIGRGALVATDQRVLLVDKKLFFVRCDEISYSAISGITYSRVGFGRTVTLHTRTGDISARTFNQVCAHHYIEAVEAHIFIHDQEGDDDNATPMRPI
jgi:hypothetical protein